MQTQKGMGDSLACGFNSARPSRNDGRIGTGGRKAVLYLLSPLRSWRFSPLLLHDPAALQ